MHIQMSAMSIVNTGKILPHRTLVITALVMAAVVVGFATPATAESAFPPIMPAQYIGPSDEMPDESKSVLPLLKQIRNGTSTENLICRDQMTLVQGISSRLACVYSDTAHILEQRGWTILRHATVDATSDQNQDVDSTQTATCGGIYDPIPPSIVDANNSFAIDFYRQVSASDAGKNIFFSPASMYVAFSALYEGAREDTALQIEDVFGFESETQKRHDSTSKLLSSLNQDDPCITLDMANALWLAERYDVYDSYADILRDTYLAHLESVSFEGDKPGVKRINQWVSENTNGKIEKALRPERVSSNTHSILTNTIYFKGDWFVPFPEENTEERDFWTGKNKVQADLMKMENPLGLDYLSTDDVQVLRLPYEGDRLSMLVILPTDEGGIRNLEGLLSAELITEWRNSLQQDTVKVTFPKFEMKTGYILNMPLAAMGMPDVFNSGLANLKGIVDIRTLPGNLYVLEAGQVAYVNVNEEGTEAAAFTYEILVPISVGPHVTYFVADHPFIFLIQDNQSGMILFMGKLVNPTIVN